MTPKKKESLMEDSKAKFVEKINILMQNNCARDAPAPPISPSPPKDIGQRVQRSECQKKPSSRWDKEADYLALPPS